MNTTIQSRRQGFTLIELLIVVLIIAVLAAIAVPNFLEFQTRAKISRVKAEMRTVATAMEAYAVDNGVYPVPSNETGGPMGDPITSGISPFETRVSPLLTTPIAYMTTRPIDPFTEKRHSPPLIYAMVTFDYVKVRATNAPTVNWLREYRDFWRDLTEQDPPSYLQYYFYSYGPDNDHDADVAHAGPVTVPHTHGDAAIYDPTNGTVSSGDIFYVGPGKGFL